MSGRLHPPTESGGLLRQTNENKEYVFYFGIKNNKKIGVAVCDTEQGKWGLIDFIILLDTETGKVKDMAVTASAEKRGRPIVRKSFLNQFAGKSSSDPITMGKDINGISGATISSISAAIAVSRAIALYEELFLKKHE
ncbi:MAG: FMN-binding protein [Nitrospirae bacterium]|nr:FMN-binding protein [Nitrospirota bacterium]